MKSLNKVALIGYLGQSPESKTTKENVSISTFSIAVNESYTDKEGNKVEKSEWINCTAFNKVAEIINKYLKKGDRIYLEGKFRTDIVEKDGEKKYFSKVIVQEIIMLGNKNSKEDSEKEKESVPVTADEDLPF